ncbi:hypothetical protein JCM10908_000857 [Rhodotorula pacifica]|uniref:uncharacterized protein n=1 Tax=Rhodotorula pacifica TaxID=1495444 RepID=UPI003180A751
MDSNHLSSAALSLPAALSTSQLVVLGVVLSLAYFVYAYRDGRAIGTKPRPDLVPLQRDDKPQTLFFGDLFTIIKDKQTMIEQLLLRQRRDGHLLKPDPSRAFTLTVPGRRMIMLSKSEHLAHVQKEAFHKYRKGPLFSNSMSQVLGKGIFVVDGHAWQMQRKATSKIFTASNFKGIITSSIQDHLRQLVAVIGEHADRGDEFDLADLFFRFTLDSFTEMAFGRSTNSLKESRPVPFAIAFDYAQVAMDIRFNNPLWWMIEPFNGNRRKMQEAVRIMDDFAYDIIAQREIDGRDGKNPGDTDLLSLYMALRDESGEPLSRQALRDALLNLIIAGRDTTAQGLSWTFFRLISEPQYFDLIRDEAASLPDVIDYDTWRSMHAITAVFEEGMRLHPAVPKNGWEAIEDDVMPNGGPRIEKGDFVAWNDWCRARDPEIWGSDAAEFKPSRFLDEKGHLIKYDEWKYHIFNGGRRLCLGMNLALFEGSAVLAALVRDFDFDFGKDYLATTPMCETERTPLYRASVTLPMSAPFIVRVKRRMDAT